MKISYAITVCNEIKEIERLLTFLFEHKRPKDQVVVQMDTTATEEVWKLCEKFEIWVAWPADASRIRPKHVPHTF